MSYSCGRSSHGQMFSLEKEPEAAEVVFSGQYQSAVKKIQSLDLSKPTAKPPSTAPGKPVGRSGRPRLSAIASVAAAGIASVSATSSVDQVCFMCSRSESWCFERSEVTK